MKEHLQTISAEAELFFELSLGSVFEASKNNVAALKHYIKAKNAKYIYLFHVC